MSRDDRRASTEQPAQATAPKPFIFVLMPFDRNFDDIYKFGIKGAAEDVEAYAERVDEQMYEGSILERIFNQISKADVVVADMSGRNSNVFYEVGYAHGLNNVTLLITQKVDDIPFDLKHRPHIVYEGNIGTLREMLGPRMAWAIGEARRRRREQLASFGLIVSMSGREIPELTREQPPSVFDFTLSTLDMQRGFVRLLSHFRNEGLQSSDPVSHIYLFAERDSKLVPSGIQEVAEQVPDTSSEHYGAVIATSFGPRYKTVLVQRARPLMPMSSSEADIARLKLNRQYRLDAALRSIPPRAVETIQWQVALLADSGPFDSTMCLRLHVANTVYDFPFRLRLAPKPEENREPVAKTS